MDVDMPGWMEGRALQAGVPGGSTRLLEETEVSSFIPVLNLAILPFLEVSRELRLVRQKRWLRSLRRRSTERSMEDRRREGPGGLLSLGDLGLPSMVNSFWIESEISGNTSRSFSASSIIGSTPDPAAAFA